MFKKWEEELQENAINSKVLCIAIFNKNHELVFANNGIKTLLQGIPSESILNPAIDKLFTLSKDETYNGIITIGSYSGINTSINARVYQKEGEILISGEIDAFAISKQNIFLSKLISENSNLQRQLIKEKKMLEITNKKLHELNNNQNILLGTAAHDLRNPIGTAFSFAELIFENSKNYTKDEIIDYIKIIKDSTNYSIELLNSLLDISAIKSGKIELKMQPQNYCKLIHSTIESNMIFARNKNININYYSEEKNCSILIDSVRINQVLNNLLSNAIKFSDRNSEIIVSVSKKGKYLKTDVKDKGQGIAENELQNLFKEFSTTSTKSTSGEKSTGLGLAIVKKVIDLHKGKIEVKSKLGKGSSFTFYLPLLNSD